MENQSLPEETSGESLANVPPAPVASAKSLSCGGLALGTTALAVAGTLFLVSSQTTRCAGATRSSKLKFADRQVQIEQALHERQAVNVSDNLALNEHGDPRATNPSINSR